MIAFTFPGQGSLRPGFGQPWLDHASWSLVAEASDAAGRDVAHLLLDADADELRETRNTQLATYVASLVVLDAVERLGVEPRFTAGHSLGEYTALTAAGVLSFEDGVALVVERGDAMQAAADEQEGVMASVLGLDEDDVRVACARVGGDVWLANFNAPGNTVIAGTPEALSEAGSVARELGASKIIPLQVGGAFHTPLMASARRRLDKALKAVELRSTETPVVANVDSTVHTDAPGWEKLLSAQLCSPVRWRHTLVTLQDEGVGQLVELGPGNVLTGLAKRGARGARALSVSTPKDLDGLLETLTSRQSEAAPVLGEHLYVFERLVLSPTAGVFRLPDGLAAGATIDAGHEVGSISGQPVRSAFAGRFMGFLAIEGERVTPKQPVAWLSQSPERPPLSGQVGAA